MNFQGATLALAAVLWGLSNGAGAAAPAASAGKGAAWPKGQYAELNALPDWGGSWVLARPKPGAPPREQPAAKGEYLKRLQDWQKQVREKSGLVPRETSNCMPPGMPGMLGTGQYPIEFLFTPGRVTVHHEAWMQWRSIWTDGRDRPKDLEPGIFGHSVGHWEGNTLVVETVSLKTLMEMAPGLKHSPKLRILERIHQDPKDPDTLLDEVTMEDPDALEKPYHVTHTYTRQRDWTLMEFICAENDRNPVDENGFTQLD